MSCDLFYILSKSDYFVTYEAKKLSEIEKPEVSSRSWCTLKFHFLIFIWFSQWKHHSSQRLSCQKKKNDDWLLKCFTSFYETHLSIFI